MPEKRIFLKNFISSLKYFNNKKTTQTKFVYNSVGLVILYSHKILSVKEKRSSTRCNINERSKSYFVKANIFHFKIKTVVKDSKIKIPSALIGSEGNFLSNKVGKKKIKVSQ